MIQNVEATNPNATLPGIRKAAILMIILGEQISGEILRQMDDEEVQVLGREIARITSINNEQAEATLEEFYQMSVAHDYVLKGGIDYAKKMLNNAFGPEHAKKLMDRLVRALGSEMASFDTLQRADPQQLAKFIHNEHPQTIALVLSHLNASQAAGLLISLPVELRGDVALRMASLDQISPEIISKIATIIGGKLKSLGEMSRESYAFAARISSFDKRAIAETKRLVNVNSLPHDDEIAPEWAAFVGALGRPASQKRLRALFDRGFHAPGDVETRLGYHVGSVGFAAELPEAGD